MAGRSKVKKEPKNRYLAIPYHILNLRGIGLCQKVLLAHIYSFGERGCYQSNRTLADIFMVAPCTISRWITDVRAHLYVKNPKGYYRTMWARAHPDVRAAAASQAVADRTGLVHLRKSEEEVAQKCASDYSKSAIRVTQKCAATNNNTNRETNRETVAPLPPMPAGGQAAAVLTERNSRTQAKVEKFKESFGRKVPKLTEQQFGQRRQQMLKALLAS